MNKRNPENASSESASEDLLRKLLAVELYRAGAKYSVIARMTGKAKSWVVETLKGFPDRRRE